MNWTEFGKRQSLGATPTDSYLPPAVKIVVADLLRRIPAKSVAIRWGKKNPNERLLEHGSLDLWDFGNEMGTRKPATFISHWLIITSGSGSGTRKLRHGF